MTDSQLLCILFLAFIDFFFAIIFGIEIGHEPSISSLNNRSEKEKRTANN